MNYYNSETLLEQQQEIEKLKEKNAALAAQVESVVNTFTDATNTPEMQAVGKILKEAFGGTPQQHLAEIRAQAVLDFAKYIDATGELNFGDSNFVLEEAAQYADSIRRGEVE